MSRRLTGRGRLVVGLTAITCLVASLWIAMEVVREPERAPARPVSTVATPMWSPRRIPALVREIAARDALARDLDAALAGVDHCLAVSDGKELLAVHAPDRALIPASAQKVLTGLAALDALGPDHVLATRAVTDAPIRDGRIEGDLYLVGGADPTLGTATYATYQAESPRYAAYPVTSIESLADAIVDAGVTSIAGSILGDDSRHDRTRYPQTWEPHYRTDGESGPLGALVANGGFAAVGGAVGVADPAAHAAALLAEALVARGVAVGSVAGSGEAPPGSTPVASVDSAPISAVVAGFVSASHNLSAEVIAREVARAAGSVPTTEAGGAAIVDRLASLGVPTQGMVAVDGSGLSRGNQVSCATLVAAIELSQGEEFSALEDALSVAGESGTLAARYAGDPLSGVLLAKTGNLAGVTSLTGLVLTPREPRFAFLANGEFSEDQGRAYQDSVADAVAAFPDVPASSDLIPAP